jgi:hypothetical protein
VQTKKIRLREQELCRKNIPLNGCVIGVRNELIIQTLMKEFGLTHEVAEYHFNNNKNSE